jgi:hypothetical protein
MRRGFQLISLVAMLLAGCATSKPTKPQQTPVDELQQSVEAQLGKDAIATKNKDGSFTLYKKEEVNPSNNLPVVKYLIVRMYDKKVVEAGSVTMGAVDWSGDFEVAITQAPGQPQLARDRNSTSRTIDVRKYIVNAR